MSDTKERTLQRVEIVKSHCTPETISAVEASLAEMESEGTQVTNTIRLSEYTYELCLNQIGPQVVEFIKGLAPTEDEEHLTSSTVEVTDAKLFFPTRGDSRNVSDGSTAAIDVEITLLPRSYKKPMTLRVSVIWDFEQQKVVGLHQGFTGKAMYIRASRGGFNWDDDQQLNVAQCLIHAGRALMMIGELGKAIVNQLNGGSDSTVSVKA